MMVFFACILVVRQLCQKFDVLAFCFRSQTKGPAQAEGDDYVPEADGVIEVRKQNGLFCHSVL